MLAPREPWARSGEEEGSGRARSGEEKGAAKDSEGGCERGTGDSGRSQDLVVVIVVVVIIVFRV